MANDQQSLANVWGQKAEILFLKTDEEFDAVYRTMHQAVLKTFSLHLYNTVDTFARFHQIYRSQKELDVQEFNSIFPVKYEEDSLSCVGLGLKIKRLVQELNPSLNKHVFSVIAQEYALDTPVPRDPPSDELALVHEHHLIALEFRLNGRPGFMLADAGLIIDIPILVMRDGRPPHTGLFKRLARTGHREYSLDFNEEGSSYAVLKMREFRENDELKDRHRFVYLGRPFAQPDALERRNWVYNFHGYILMGSGGVRACLHFVLGKDKRKFIVFVPGEAGKTISADLPYEFFKDSRISSSEESENAWLVLDAFSRLCNLGGREAVLEKFRPVSEACCDEEFIREVLRIHERHQSALQAALL